MSQKQTKLNYLPEKENTLLFFCTIVTHTIMEALCKSLYFLFLAYFPQSLLSWFQCNRVLPSNWQHQLHLLPCTDCLILLAQKYLKKLNISRGTGKLNIIFVSHIILRNSGFRICRALRVSPILGQISKVDKIGLPSHYYTTIHYTILNYSKLTSQNITTHHTTQQNTL